MKCNECIHDSIIGCMMLDCPHHPNSEKCAEILMTNTFHDRFVDREKGYSKEVEEC